jgi:predicted lipoprotein
MTRKIIKCLLLVVVIGLLGYNSVYIKKLSEVQAQTPKAFDAVAFTNTLWTEQLPARLDSAVRLDVLVSALRSNPGQAIEQYCRALAIGNIRYSLVKATGRVTAVDADEITLQVPGNPLPLTVKLATEYVYGNAIRDASGLVDINNFVNTTDLSNISEEMNKRVRTGVLPPFKAAVQKSDSIMLAGALELNKEHLKLDELNIIPVQVKIVQ